jgi:hypothetical protein
MAAFARRVYEPLYDIHPDTGATFEVFYADRVFDGLRGPGWFWWICKSGGPPDWPPFGPFGTSYTAYRDALAGASTAAAPPEPGRLR